MYTSEARNNHDKYNKWIGASACNCIAVDLKALSLYTDNEPLQHTIAFSDGNCQTTLGTITKQRCVGTDSLSGDGDIGSVMFWLPGICDVVEALKDIIHGVNKLLNTGEVASVVSLANLRAGGGDCSEGI
ncbi:predicted protein [Sclerotinia sclerotiorum 1980 UF-70]|uniref:Uncharacterized protein n=1 Tax=Sclerotinia sclerotiorum (strain ATCC 18683 / 1980 / Ss-1) TaxID=665079 RepID=A7EEI7_SCLS1|nr:predicted protein [Sclerotinia sclerotiorum 1980 UF-70]EDO01253.1 predicted protein [Sclerotinia sclerotiorum 1980 UF-70]